MVSNVLYARYFEFWFSIIYILSVFFFTSPLVWLKDIKRYGSGFLSKKTKIIYVLLISIITFLRVSSVLYDHYVLGGSPADLFYGVDNSFLYYVVSILNIFIEELLFKFILLRYMMERGKSKFKSYLVICLLFALLHFLHFYFSWYFVLNIIMYCVFQLSSLFLFELYPSLILSVSYHVLWNIGIFLP